MFIGVARIVLHIPGARSLKDRRRVVKSFKDRVRARLPVSVAEVGELELRQVATLGLAVVSGSSARCRRILSQAASLASSIGDALVADVATEVVSFGAGGSGIRGGIEKALEADASPDFPEDDDEMFGDFGPDERGGA